MPVAASQQPVGHVAGEHVATQVPFVQLAVAPQAAHETPPVPHVVLELVSHAPVVEQHPVQVDGEQGRLASEDPSAETSDVTSVAPVSLTSPSIMPVDVASSPASTSGPTVKSPRMDVHAAAATIEKVAAMRAAEIFIGVVGD
jgi:hypothetical protein